LWWEGRIVGGWRQSDTGEVVLQMLEDDLPQIHPLIDLCNATSLAFAVPMAVFDAYEIGENVEVRYAV